MDMEIELKSWDKGNITFLTFFFENLGKGVYDFFTANTRSCDEM